MSRDWEQNFTSIVKETELNLAKVRQSLNGSRYSHRSLNNNPPVSGFPVKSSTLPRDYMTSSSFSRNDYTSLSDWRPHAGYHGIFTHGASSQGESLPSSSTESPAMIALLTEKVDNQAKTMHSLSRQVDSLERERDRNQTHLRRQDQELSSLGHRLQEGGVHLETERKIDGWRREVMLQLGDLRDQVTAQRRNAAGDEGRHGDEVLNSLTKEVHDFKRHMQEDLAVCRREIDSLNTRLMRHEIDISNNQADGKDLGRRIDRADRTLAGVSDSQRSHSRDLNHSLQGRQTNDQELHQLRAEVNGLMSTVERLENDVLTNSRGIAEEKLGELKLNSPYHNGPASVNGQSRLTSSKDTGRTYRKPATGKKASKSHKSLVNPAQPAVSDSDDLDASVSLSLASSDSDDFSLSLPPHYARNVQRGTHSTYTRDDESSDAFSEPTSALVGHDPTLDLVDLASTPSISSIELDADLL